MSNHTKWPWKWDGNALWRIGSGYMPDEKNNPHLYLGILKDEKINTSDVYEVMEVIKFAPDMLDMLKRIEKCYAGEGMWFPKVVGLMPEIRALIQRAEGGEDG